MRNLCGDNPKPTDSGIGGFGIGQVRELEAESLKVEGGSAGESAVLSKSRCGMRLFATAKICRQERAGEHTAPCGTPLILSSLCSNVSDGADDSMPWDVMPQVQMQPAP
ncbi:hypothetical protein L682_06375 [Aquipseudomonas alcaligenes OT 69]|nr:hypothetical protein L682_06375 [Pseudomonas alcaligenes OT 69]